jgi:hypothetical protein
LCAAYPAHQPSSKQLQSPRHCNPSWQPYSDHLFQRRDDDNGHDAGDSVDAVFAAEAASSHDDAYA